MLFTVMTIMLGLSIIALGFNTLKKGTVEQLAKSADQNRLALLSHSANAELLAIIKNQINDHPEQTPFYPDFREAFNKLANKNPPTDPPYVCQWDINSPETFLLAKGYGIDMKSRAILCVNKRANSSRSPAFTGYLELISQATHKSSASSVEIKERRDVKLVDLRDFFDKYVLYVKNFCPDLNNPKKRIALEGFEKVNWEKQIFSHVYLGTESYPIKAAGERPTISLDLNMTNDEQLICRLFDFPSLTKYGFAVQDISYNMAQAAGLSPLPQKYSDQGKNKLFWVCNPPLPFNSISSANSFAKTDFMGVNKVKEAYLKCVNIAAEAILSKAENRPPDKDPRNFIYDPGRLKTKCSTAKTKANAILNDPSLSGAFTGINDYIGNGPSGSDFKTADFTNCTFFGDMIGDCISKWTYHFGFTDAETVWNLNSGSLQGNIPRVPTTFADGDPFCGLKTLVTEYYVTGGNTSINAEKTRFGSMLDLYNLKSGTMRPLLVEGDVKLRFYKLAFFDEFQSTIQILSGASTIPLPFVPLEFIRRLPPLPPPPPPPFSNRTLAADLFPFGSLGGKNRLVSGVDTLGTSLNSEIIEIPVNRVLIEQGRNINIASPSGDPTKNYLAAYQPEVHGNLLFPSQKGASGVPKSGSTFFPAVKDFATFAHIYLSQDEMKKELLINGTLCIDGKILVLQGDLDLSGIAKFRGNGFIYVQRGDCKIGDLLQKSRDIDLLRIYLQTGSFWCVGTASPVKIEASLIATTFVSPSDNIAGYDKTKRQWQGKLIPNGKSVEIKGNLVVDYLFTEGDQFDAPEYAVPDGGEIRIIHDTSLCAEPDPTTDPIISPYRISIGQVRTMYSMNAAGPTL